MSTKLTIRNMINMINKLYFILLMVSDLRKDEHGKLLPKQNGRRKNEADHFRYEYKPELIGPYHSTLLSNPFKVLMMF